MSMALILLRTVDQARKLADSGHREGLRLALVPTMGSLHAGHLALVEEGKRLADRVVVTLFVNPIQFGPKDDFSKYPRDLSGDLEKCNQAAVAAVFAPD